jgi:hypothetical protein
LTIDQLSLRAAARVSRKVTLQVAGFAEQLEVTPTVVDQRLTNAFTRELTVDQLAALPEDPEELAFVLRQLVGDDATSEWTGSGEADFPRVPRSAAYASATTVERHRAAVGRASRSRPRQAGTAGVPMPV